MTRPHFATSPGLVVAASGQAIRSLRAGEAISLSARTRSVLHVAAGHLWATLEGPHGATPVDEGDLVLGPGAELEVQAGNRLVIEAWHRGADSTARFSFDPLPETTHCVGAAASRWQNTVILPGRELVAALARAIAMLARLGWGLASYAEFLVAGRGRVLGRLESNSP